MLGIHWFCEKYSHTAICKSCNHSIFHDKNLWIYKVKCKSSSSAACWLSSQLYLSFIEGTSTRKSKNNLLSCVRLSFLIKSEERFISSIAYWLLFMTVNYPSEGYQLKEGLSFEYVFLREPARIYKTWRKPRKTPKD